jgi:hypothetical protein
VVPQRASGKTSVSELIRRFAAAHMPLQTPAISARRQKILGGIFSCSYGLVHMLTRSKMQSSSKGSERTRFFAEGA